MYHGQVLPNLLLILAFSLPLFTNDLRNFRVGETWVAGRNALLVVLSIENKCYKALASNLFRSSNKDQVLCPRNTSAALTCRHPR